ncbi:MAG: hypothetical protein ACJAYU_005052 [Bradymonadia bacterium]|jgi:hypothetical protein
MQTLILAATAALLFTLAPSEAKADPPCGGDRGSAVVVHHDHQETYRPAYVPSYAPRGGHNHDNRPVRARPVHYVQNRHYQPQPTYGPQHRPHHRR